MIKTKYYSIVCVLLEWLGKRESKAYQHHLKMFAMQILKMEGTT